MKGIKNKKTDKKGAEKSLILSKRNEWILVAFILLVTFLLFSPAVKNDFVGWDDDQNITANPNINEINATTLKNMFSSTITGGYTPLTTLSFAVENQFFGIKPGVFHFNNLILHLLVTLLLYIFLRKLGIGQLVALIAIVLFGIHPMRVESVVWITERKDLLYSSFFLFSLILYLSWYKTKRLLFYFLSLLVFILALLSKIQAVSLPLILLLVDFFLEGRFRFRQIWNKIPFFILSLIAGIAGLYILWTEGTIHTASEFPLIQRIFIGTFSLCVYLIKAVIPYQFSAIYPYPEKIPFLYYASLPAVGYLAYLVYKYGKTRKELVFGSLFFLFNVIFVLQIVGAGQAFLADRFTYLPYAGLFLLMATGFTYLLKSKQKSIVIFAGVSVLVIFAMATLKRIPVWKNSETLFTDVIRKYPEVSIAYNNLGVYYRDQNQNDKAIRAYSKTIELKPYESAGYNNRGEIYFNLGEVEKALKDMNTAIELKPDYVKALTNRGAVWGSKGEFSKAMADLDKAIQLDPENLSAYSNRILTYYAIGDHQKAILDADSYLAIKSDEPDIVNIRGLCYDRLNNNQAALDDFNRAIQMDSRAGAYYKNRSMVLYRMGDRDRALTDILRARDLGAKIDPAYLKLLQSK